MAITMQRLEELRAMEYSEYLRTPEWQATRKRILKRDKYQCQGCGAKGVVMNVHHLTYDRLGSEEDEDLVTLCEVCHEYVHGIEPELSFGHKTGVFALTAVLGTIGLEGLLQAPFPAEIGLLLGAYFLAKQSPAMYRWLRQKLPKEMLSWLESEQEQEEYTFFERMRGLHLHDQQQAAEPTEEDVEAEYRRMMREDIGQKDLLADERDSDDLLPLSFGTSRKMAVFSELLKSGWRPSLSQIFVGTDERGRHLFVKAQDLCHVALSGATKHGKSSLLRLIMAQLCSLKLSVILLNPHYTIFDRDHNEDWTPYTPYLKSDPMECKEMVNIEKTLKWAVETLLEGRKRRVSQGNSAGKPFFFILDEYPDIKAEISSAPEYVGKLLRQGRKYGIFLIVASQDFAVKTLGVEGEGAVRKCFLTTFYVGGDPITARELLNTPIKDIPENRLGKGTVMLKYYIEGGDEKPITVHVPYLDNESLYILLGPSTFVPPAREERDTDELDEPDVTVTSFFESAQKAPKSAETERVTVTSSAARDDVPETASEEGGTGQNGDVALPAGWTKVKLDMLPGFYRVLGNLDKSLEALEVSVTQRNRDYAREILRQQGLWKG